MREEKVKKKTGLGQRNRNRMIFYIIGVSLPVLQFCIFYIGVNFNSILLSFQDFDLSTGKYSYVGLENFRWIVNEFKASDNLINAVGRSFIAFGFTLLQMFLALLFSFYIYKKETASGLFKTVLFMPKIISGVILVIIFKFLVQEALPEIFTSLKPFSLLNAYPEERRFWPVMFFAVWTGFGSNVLLFGGAMSGISDSVVEAAQLDGITPLKEFFLITVPMIFSTLSTFILMAVAGIFTNQLGLYSFYGNGASPKIWTFGYYLFKETQEAGSYGYEKLPRLAAIGLCLTAVTVPVIMVVRKGLDKLGPKVE